jgi:heptosyltransferase I
MKILIIKTSSLGDVVHLLPALTDAAAAVPGLQVDWVVEAGFAAIPALHPAVRRVIPVAIRRWRKQLGRAETWREMAAFRRALRADRYDLVLDAQGLLKSALLAVQAVGPRAGLDALSAREPWVTRFYDRRYAAPRELHAIHRNRLLMAQALGYAMGDAAAVRYGLAYGLAGVQRDAPLDASVLCLHGTARVEKEYPEADWVLLARALLQQGLTPIFAAGNARERARAERIVAACPGAQVLPAMALAELIPVVATVRAVVGVDTGLMHLAAALRRPGVGLYPATDPARFGAMAEVDAAPIVNLSAAMDLDPSAVAARLLTGIGGLAQIGGI